MIINIFQNLKVAHDTKQVYNFMKTTKNYSVNVKFNGVFENTTNSEIKQVSNEIVEQLSMQLFDHVANIENLRDIANSLCQTINEQYKLRKSEIKPAETAQMTVIKPVTKPAVEEAQAEEIKTKEASQPKHTTKRTAKATKKTEAKAKEEAEVKQVSIASLTKDDIKKMEIKFTQYSEKCVALSGETKPIKEEIKRLAGGHWNSFKKCWFLKNDQGHALAKAMHCRVAKEA